mgnify:CR=1 FL=1
MELDTLVINFKYITAKNKKTLTQKIIFLNKCSLFLV